MPVRTRGLGPSSKAVAERLRKHICREPGCGAKLHVEKVSGKESQRCWKHLLKLRADVKKLTEARKARGLCRCGKHRVRGRMTKCFQCTFRIKRRDVGKDWVAFIEKHPKAWRKLLP